MHSASLIAAESRYQSCCKIGTGFKDEDLKTHYEFFQNHGVEEKPSDYDVDSKLCAALAFIGCFEGFNRPSFEVRLILYIVYTQY